MEERTDDNLGNKNSSVWTEYGGGNAPKIYERHLVPTLFEPFAKDLIQLSNLEQAGGTVLDVACGTGILSRLVAGSHDVVGRVVVGIDVNPSMLRMARHSSSGKNIELIEGSAMSLPFPDESFTLVMCQQGLQFFPDKLQALREMSRVLVGTDNSGVGNSSGGRLALNVWASIKDSPGFDILEQLLQHAFGQEAATIMRMPYSLSDPSEVFSFVKANGFGDIVMREVTKIASFSSIQEFILVFTRGSMLASYFSKVKEIEYKKLLNNAERELSPFVNQDSGRISFPLKSWFVLARKEDK